VALDYSYGMLAAARKKAEKHGWTNIEFVQADATQMDLEPNSLDGAICTFGLSAMPGELAALQRAANAMKPGARFVAFDAKPFTGWGRVLNPISKPIFKYATNWNYAKDTVASLREVFGVVEVEEYNSGLNYIAICRKS
jgi:demethylmenaquinone methyltransferase/2-methoxy-6-polyprenyl-1,4-benzoquinol methylase